MCQARSSRLRPRGRNFSKLLFVGVLILASTLSASAQPPPGADPNSEMAKWFKSLKSKEGSFCCDISDCRRVEARLVNSYYEVLLYDEWYRVPDSAVIHVANPTGQYIACFYPNEYSEKFSPYFFCFVPISLTDAIVYRANRSNSVDAEILA